MSDPIEVLQDAEDAIRMAIRNKNPATAKAAVDKTKEAANMMIPFYGTVATSLDKTIHEDISRKKMLEQTVKRLEADISRNKFNYQRKMHLPITNADRLKTGNQEMKDKYLVVDKKIEIDKLGRKIDGVQHAMESTWFAEAKRLMSINEEADILAVQSHDMGQIVDALDIIVYRVALAVVLTQKAMLEKENGGPTLGTAYNILFDAKDGLQKFFESSDQFIMARQPVGGFEREKEAYSARLEAYDRAKEREQLETQTQGANSSGGRRKRHTLHKHRKQCTRRKLRKHRKHRKQCTHRK
jgi:hypothetical protein